MMARRSKDQSTRGRAPRKASEPPASSPRLRDVTGWEELRHKTICEARKRLAKWLARRTPAPVATGASSGQSMQPIHHDDPPELERFEAALLRFFGKDAAPDPKETNEERALHEKYQAAERAREAKAKARAEIEQRAVGALAAVRFALGALAAVAENARAAGQSGEVVAGHPSRALSYWESHGRSALLALGSVPEQRAEQRRSRSLTDLLIGQLWMSLNGGVGRCAVCDAKLIVEACGECGADRVLAKNQTKLKGTKPAALAAMMILGGVTKDAEWKHWCAAGENPTTIHEILTGRTKTRLKELRRDLRELRQKNANMSF